MKPYLDLAPFCFFSMDDHGQLLTVNATFCTLLGLSKEELLQQNIATRVSFGTRIFFQTHFFPMIRINNVASEVFLHLVDASRKQIPVLLNARRIDDGQPEIVCAAIVIENRNQYENEIIAARKYAERAQQENTELQEARQTLQQHAEALDAQVLMLEQRNRDLQQVNRVLTHNLQEPLRKIMVLSSKLLQKQQEVPPVIFDVLERINQVAFHTRDLVDQVQRFVQMDVQETRSEPVDLNLVLQTLADRQEKKPPQCRITLQLSPIPLVWGNTEHLNYLFEELLLNAYKFAHPQKPLQITLSTQVAKFNKFRRLEHRYRYTDFVCVRITDNGKGFDNSYAETVFQLFQKLDPQSEGMGLGLALCKKIIERQQGFITANSHEGVGTEICCYLPLECGRPGVQ